VKITVTESPTANVNPSDIVHETCGNSNGSVTISASGGTSPYTYLWNDANVQTTETATNLSAGDYQVTVTDDNGCTATATVTILQATTDLAVNIPEATIVDETCGNSNGSATVSGTGGTSPYTYLWNDANAQTTETATNLSAGDYQVTVTDDNGCTATATVTILQANNSLSVQIDNFTNVTCYGFSDGMATASATGGDGAYTFSWEKTMVQVAVSPNNLSAGKYIVVVTDGNGCVDTAQVEIAQPEELLLSVTANNTIVCAGELSELSATSMGGVQPHIISWNGLSTAWNFSPVITKDSIFVATVTDANGCTTSSQISMNVSELPIVLFDDSPQSICLGSQITFDNLSTGNFTNCEWTFSDGTIFNDCGTITYTANTIGEQDITLTIYNSDGCKASHVATGVLNVLQSPTAAFTTDKTDYNLLENEVFFINLSQNASNYLWYFDNDSLTSDIVNPTHEYSHTKGGNYVVTLIAWNGKESCSDTVFKTISIKETEVFYISNTFTPDDNGLNEMFKPIITAGIAPSFYNFEIYNRWGEIIFHTQDINEGWNGVYKGKHSPQGAYTWKIRLQYSENANRKEYTGNVNLIR